MKRQKSKSILGLTNQAESKLVGVRVTPQFDNVLMTHCLALGISKSTMLRQALDKWIQLLDLHEEELLLKIGERTHAVWIKKKTKSPRSTFREFKTQLQKELKWKGLDSDQIESVLMYLESYEEG